MTGIGERPKGRLITNHSRTAGRTYTKGTPMLKWSEEGRTLLLCSGHWRWETESRVESGGEGDYIEIGRGERAV